MIIDKYTFLDCLWIHNHTVILTLTIDALILWWVLLILFSTLIIIFYLCWFIIDCILHRIIIISKIYCIIYKMFSLYTVYHIFKIRCLFYSFKLTIFWEYLFALPLINRQTNFTPVIFYPSPKRPPQKAVGSCKSVIIKWNK